MPHLDREMEPSHIAPAEATQLSGRELRHRRMDQLNLFAINGGRIELPVRIDELQPCVTIGRLDLAIEAGVPPGMTRCTLLLDADPDRVLIAIHAHLDHALGMT